MIQRIVRLIFDRASGRRTEEDAKKSLGGIDAAVNRVRLGVIALGGAIVAALGIRKIINFGREAVNAARATQQAWESLAVAVDGAGGSFQEIESHLRGLSSAFEDATVHDDDQFAMGLARLTTLTGDVEASINNMGLVANVAA